MRTGRHEAPRPKASKKKKALIITAIILLCVVGFYLFLVYTPNAFVSKWRTIYIETAMTTLSHKWLATAFLPDRVIQEVMDASAAVQAQQAEVVSTWGGVEPAAQAAAPVQEPGIPTQESDPLPPVQEPEESVQPIYENAPDVQPQEPEPVETPQALEGVSEDHADLAAAHAAQQALIQAREMAAAMTRSDFYSVYTELDPDRFEAFLQEHYGYYEDGYGGIVIEDFDNLYDLRTIYDERILVLDVPNNLILMEVTGSDYVGKLAIVKDPRQVYLEPAKGLGNSGYGNTITQYYDNYHSLVAINASGFDDPGGEGWGGYVVGTYYAHGKDYTNFHASIYKTFGFRSDYRMYIENPTTYDSDNYLWAMQFSPALIVDGEEVVAGSYGWGMQPRSAVGQGADGSFMLLTVDGRQVGYSIGCTVEDCADILLMHGAYQAMNLDGGSSTVMTYNGKIITRPSSVTDFGRYLPNAFVIHRADDLPEP